MIIFVILCVRACLVLEPAGNGSINITEKIAEANKKLYEESDEEIINDRKHFRKVQFSDNLVNFEPGTHQI